MTKGVDDKNSGASGSPPHSHPLLLAPNPVPCTGACRSHKAHRRFMRASRPGRRRVTGYEACDDLNEHTTTSAQSSADDEHSRVGWLTKGLTGSPAFCDQDKTEPWTHGQRGMSRLNEPIMLHIIYNIRKQTSILWRLVIVISKYAAQRMCHLPALLWLRLTHRSFTAVVIYCSNTAIFYKL